MKFWKRWLPAVIVLTLLAVALVARNSPVSARSTPNEIALSYPTCTNITQGGVGDTTTYSIAIGEGIDQPLGAAPNTASTILSIAPAYWSQVTFTLSYWDPATLAPPAGLLALRTITFPATTVAQYMDASRIDFFPPLVTKALPNVAEPPPAEIAAKWVVTNGSAGGRTATLVPSDVSGSPSAFRIHADGTETPIAGAHPAFVHELCGGDAALQAMRVVQSVMHTDIVLDPHQLEYIQKFRVPVGTSVNWIEVAFGPYSGVYNGPGNMRIFDATEQSDPPPTFGTPILDAPYVAFYGAPGQWTTHADLTTNPTLVPNHDYWLAVTTVGSFSPFAKHLNGTESPYFQTEIGGLYSRPTSGAAASLLPDEALSFRVIGTPTGTTGVGDPGPRRGAFALAISPNPARGATTIGWSGAQGTVSLDVIDARGRRVATATSDAGRWSWNGAGADGRALSAGVYFVRARDGAGRTASARVTLVR